MTRQQLLAAIALPILLAAIAFLRPSNETRPQGGDTDDNTPAPLPAPAMQPTDGAGYGEPITLAEAPATQIDEATNASSQAEPTAEALETLPDSEQRSLWDAFHAARRAVLPLSTDEAAMHHNEGVRYFAQNPAQQLVSRFLDGAVRIGPGQAEEGWAASLSLAGGRGTPPVLKEGRVEYRHANGVTEWYENRAEGIEHAFTVARRPAGAEGALRLELELEGVSARHADRSKEETGSGTLEFLEEEGGTPVLRYGEVTAWDAAGRYLAARYEVSGRRVGILVADAGAAYPVTVDPLIVSHEARLEGGDAGADDSFGYSVSLDGNTALIGASLDDTAAGTDSGSAHVFVRSGTDWSHQAKLLAPAHKANDYFGWCVSLDGNNALVGAHGTDMWAINAGSAHVFVRSGTDWSHQAALLAPTPWPGAYFGRAVSLDGDRALVGALGADTGALDAGSAHIFVRSGTDWSHQAELLAPAPEAYAYFGISVSLDGDTALVGAYQEDTVAGTNAGSAHVFVCGGSVWSHQSTLLAPNPRHLAHFGKSVSLDGDTALVGAYLDDTAAGTDAGSAHVFVRSGWSWSHQAELLAPDGEAGDRFGWSVSLDGDTALVGAYQEDTVAGTNAGSAHVFVRSGLVWSHQAKLEAGDARTDDCFGWSVSLDGDTALVGVDQDDTVAGTDAGSAHVFVRSGNVWSHQGTLLAPGAAANDFFGASVSLDGGTALVGAYGYSRTEEGNNGSAHVFVRSGNIWIHQAKLEASDTVVSDDFGYSVSLDGDTALVGARLDDTAAGRDAGSVHVFVRSGSAWSHEARLEAPQATVHDNFGRSVSLDGDTAIVGARQSHTAAGSDAGSVHVFVRSSSAWNHQATLEAPDAVAGDEFGYSVSLDGGTALVGARRDDTAAGSDTGSAHVFVRSGSVWSHQAKLEAPEAMANDFFGASVSLDGDTALVGADYDDTAAGDDTGSAHVFVRSGSTWSHQATIEAPDAATGDNFAHSLSLDGDTALVGVRRDDTAAGSDAGSVHVFRLIKPRIEVYDGLSTAPANRRDDGTATIDFGSVHVGDTSSASTFTLLNAGDADLVLGTVSFSGPGTPHFSATNPSATTLVPGGTAAFSVSFAPAEGGPWAATVEIASDDPRLPSFRIPLLGEGLAAPTFSSRSLRIPSVGKPLDLAGTSGVTPPGGTFSGPGVSGGLFDPRSLPPGAYTLIYSLADSRGKLRTATLSVTVLSSPLLRAKAPKPFTPTVLGTRSGTRRILVSNRGEQPATGLRAVLKGPDRAGFRIHRLSVRTLKPGATASVTASFRPRKTGSYRATVEVIARETNTKAVLRGRAYLP